MSNFETKLNKDSWLNRAHGDRLRAIYNGKSKATVLTQDEIGFLFGFGIDDKKSSTNNLFSDTGVLTHYNTIEAIRLKDGKIIRNRQCFARGFASCCSVSNVFTYMDLTMLRNFLSGFTPDLTNMQILDNDDDAILFTYKGEYYLNGRDLNENRARYVAELVQPVKTIKEAYESMKPQGVKIAEAMNAPILRQGDLFFIEQSEALTQFKTSKDAKKRSKQPVKRVYYQCVNCELKTKSEIVQNNTYGNTTYEVIPNHPTSCLYSGYPESWTTKQKECAEKNEYNKDIMKRIEYDGFEYSPYPVIRLFNAKYVDSATNHTATKFLMVGHYAYVKGTIRHTENQHKALKLTNPKSWYYVLKNVTKRAQSVGLGGGD